MVKKAKEDMESLALWIISNNQLIEGLLHVMVFRRSGVRLFSEELYDEASIVKLCFLFCIFLPESPDIRYLVNNPHESFIVEVGFQLFLDLFSSKKMPVFSQFEIFWDNARKLLQDIRQLNQLPWQDEWEVCLASTLHQILFYYVSKGLIILQQPPIKFLIELLANPCFARRFLDAITLFPDLSNGNADKGTVNAAFQIFEAVYKSSPLTIVTSCASKVVDHQTDSTLVRLECLVLLGKIRSCMESNMRQYNGQQTWPVEVVRCIMMSVFSDSSVRVRRAAFQLLLQIEPPEVDEQELLFTVFVKIRDEDKKVKLLAFQRLLRFPMKLLYSNFASKDWKLIFQHALSQEGSHVYEIAKDLLLKYLSSDSMPPSRRLKILDFAHRDNYQKYGKLIGNHIAEIFEMEVKFLDLYSCDDDNPSTFS